MNQSKFDEEAWRLASLVYYYDELQTALVIRSADLEKLGPEDQLKAVVVVAQCVGAAIGQLDDDALTGVAVSMIDDLYRAACTMTEWSTAQAEYVAAVWGTAFKIITERGFTVRYVIENTWQDGLVRPIDAFPMIFSQAGFVYLCPHAMAANLPDAAGAARTFEALKNVIAEGRDIASMALKQLSGSRRHLVYLEADYQKGCLDEVIALPSPLGLILIERHEAPTPGSKVNVTI